MDIQALFEKMVVLFTILFAGFFCGKAGIMDVESNKSLSRLVANLTNPMLVLASVMTDERLLSPAEVLQVTLLAAGCYAFLIASSLLLPRLLHLGLRERGPYRFFYIFSNIGFMGYPLVRAMFGEGAMFHLTIFVLFFQLVCWSYGAQTISGEGRFRLSWRILKTPCVLAALLAYAIYLSGVHIPRIVADVVKTTGEITSPLAMLILGCALSQCSLRDVFGRPKLYLLALVKLIVVPLAAFFVLRTFIKDPLLLSLTTVVLAMPAATNATILTYQNHGDDRLAASGVFLTTLLSVASVPGLMLLLFG